MKNVSVLALSAMTTIGALPFSAYATPVSHLYANGIVANNIVVMQHSALLNAFNNFDGAMAISLGKHYVPENKEPAEKAEPEKTSPDRYGTMPLYGEYGDDGTVFSSGRSGGEYSALDSNWFDWHHTQDSTKFDDFSVMNTRSDVISLGLAGGHNELEGGFSEWGAFGGVAIAHEDNSAVDIAERGGYIGIYSGYHMYGFNIAVAGDFGAMFNSAESDFGTDDFTNIWLGGALNASYNIVLDDSFTLQPGVYLGYTWIKSNSYESESGHDIENSDFNMIELSPSLRAIKHIAGDWYGAMSARYVFNFANGGDAEIAGVKLPELELGNYSEYGLSIEKNIDRFNVAIMLNRRDGGRTGWNGGVQVRCVF